MKRLKKSILSMAVMGMVLAIAYPAFATFYNICGKEVSIEGFIRQEFGFNVNSSSEYKTNQTGLQSAYQMWYLDTNVVLSPNWEVRGIFRMWGDLIYAIRSNHGHFERTFKSAKKNLQWDDDFNQILREFYVTYDSPKFLIRVGKQQIGWGEADGLRLMDVVNPLDARRDFIFYDTEGYEEVRIPKWLIKTVIFPGDIGGLRDFGVELLWNPGDVKEFGNLLPPMVDAHLAGGVFGAWPRNLQKQWGAFSAPSNFAPLPVRLNKKERSTSIDNSEYGVRITFNWRRTFFTLNYWQGFSHSEVLKFKGILPDGGGIMMPGGPPFPVAMNFDREWERIKIAGFTINRELLCVRKLIKQPAPVLRVEALYSFDETFNTREFIYPFGPMGPPSMVFKTTTKDQIRYMIGLDWSMNIPFINSGRNTFVSPQFFHVHTLNYRGNRRALLQVAPYDWRFPKNQFYVTLLLRTEYKNSRVNPSMLFVQDCHSHAAWIKSKVYFRIGDHWRPEIGYLWIKRNTDHTAVENVPGVGPVPMSDDWKNFGLMEDRDQVWIRIQYQF